MVYSDVGKVDPGIWGKNVVKLDQEYLPNTPESGRVIVLIIRHLTPYWEEAIFQLRQALGNEVRVGILFGGRGADDLHPWDETDSCSSKGAEDVLIPPSGGKEWWGTVWPAPKMWKELDRINPDMVIIHEYSPYVVFSGLLWAKSKERPCVVTSDVGPEQRRQLGWIQRCVHSVVNQSVEGVLAKTQDAMDQSRILQKMGLLAPHAIDTRFYSQRKRLGPGRYFIQVGSLIPRKGIDLLLKAFQLARKSRKDIRLELVGSGDHVGVNQLIREMGLMDSVNIRDFMQPAILARAYEASDVFVLASRFDSYGLVVHEAAASGLPLVVSKYAGASCTLVENGINGFQVDPTDVEGFAECLLQVADAANYQSFSEASRQLARKHDLQTVSEGSAKWLRQLMEAYPKTEEKNKTRQSSKGMGFLRWGASFFRHRLEAFMEWGEMDAFHSSRREIIFLNRYIPFYREPIFQKVASWKSVRLLYSGKTLGNLRSVEGVESVPVHCFEWAKNIIWLRSVMQLWIVRPRLVCTEFSISLWSTWILFCLRPLMGFKIVFWAHGLQHYGWRGNHLDIKDRVRLLWIRWSDAMLFYSEDRKKDVEVLTGKQAKYFVSPNAQDTRHYDRIHQELAKEGRTLIRQRLGMDLPTLVYLGRLNQEKEVMRLPLLLEFLEKAVPVRLEIIGSGELEQQLREACHPFAERVRFHGSIFNDHQKAEILFASDLMVSPGYLGLNVVDSLVMGCPVATLANYGLVKRHSPEITYLSEGVNLLMAHSLAELSGKIVSWLETGCGLSKDREFIRKKLLEECNTERQFEGMKQAFSFVLDEKH